jgi:exodeoxyribonuclease VII large subunit
MQGEQVEESIIRALQAVCADAQQWDCIVIIRGGGAAADL